jgi:hypothetical protein
MHVSLVPNKSINPGRQDYSLLGCNNFCIVTVYHCERATCGLHLQGSLGKFLTYILKIKAVGSFETLVGLLNYQTSRHHIPEKCNINNQCLKKGKRQILTISNIYVAI